MVNAPALEGVAGRIIYSGVPQGVFVLRPRRLNPWRSHMQCRYPFSDSGRPVESVLGRPRWWGSGTGGTSGPYSSNHRAARLVIGRIPAEPDVQLTSAP